MYSGTTFTKLSGRMLGAHQKIDRVARQHLAEILPRSGKFPKVRAILHFEGKNGPDAIKRKSPAQDEPWHYYSPFDKDDSKLIELIRDHYKHLVDHLKNGNEERAAFEAAWLAHALVDGLTPAHHYPYEDKLVELRGGESINTRTTIRDKLIMPGKNRREQLKNNWKMWGAKGLIMTHSLFEFGIATLIAPLSFNNALPTEADIKAMEEMGIIEWFKNAAREIAVLDLYEAYYKRGWTSKLARQIRGKLAPTIIKTVTLAWYSAMEEAGQVKAKD